MEFFYKSIYYKLCVVFSILSLTLHGQIVDYNLNSPGLPAFIRSMYSPNPNIHEVAKLFNQYKSDVLEPAKKKFYENSNHKGLKFRDQYEHQYKTWMSQNLNNLTPDGVVDYSQKAIQNRQDLISRIHPKNTTSWRSKNEWEPLGPFETIHKANGNPISEQANVFDIAYTPLYPEYIYAGTAAGGLFKSTDHGKNWKRVGLDQNFRWVQAVGLTHLWHGYVRVGIPGKIMYSDDGGTTWANCPIIGKIEEDFQTFQIVHCSDPKNYHIAYAATSDGMLRSEDYGKSWTKIFEGRCTSVEEHPTKPSTVYSLNYDVKTRSTEFVFTENYGKNWFKHAANNGWFYIPPIDQGKFNVWGGRIAVTPAAPDNVYVILNEAFSDDSTNLKTNGFIGLYVSDNKGATWVQKNQQIGVPYNDSTHKNLMSYEWAPYSYNQVDYLNNAIAVSSIDPNTIYVGAMRMWRSTDGGSSWSMMKGNPKNPGIDIHADIRRIKLRKVSSIHEELMWCSDGGFNFSEDGKIESHEARNKGLHAVEYWGFDIDNRIPLLGGGTYHNGNNFFQTGFPEGIFKQAEGVEEATGFVQYGNNPSISFFHQDSYYSKTFRLLNSISNLAINSANILQNDDWSPNMSLDYFPYRGSNVIVDINSANQLYWGHKNKFCRSDDFGTTATVIYTFEDSVRVEWFEQDNINGNIFYVKTESVKKDIKNKWKFYVSLNRGSSWSQIRGEIKEDFLFTAKDNVIVLASGGKIEKSDDQGKNWTDLTTPILDKLNIRSICIAPGHKNNIYIATNLGGVFNYDIVSKNWISISNGLSPAADATRLLYYSPGALLILATRGLGLYGYELEDSEVERIVPAFSSDFTSNYCVGEEVHFFNRSSNTSNAEYNWYFEKGTPSNSKLENPVVRFYEPGTWPVFLSIYDRQFDLFATTSSSEPGNKYITVVSKSILPYRENFETGVINNKWIITDLNQNNIKWEITKNTSAYGLGSYSLFFKNFEEGDTTVNEEVRLVNGDLTNVNYAELKFDIAYAKFDQEPNRNDSLAILISTDCGTTKEIIYKTGGEKMKTAIAKPGAFIPRASEWRSIRIDLSKYIGEQNVQLIFQNRGNYGNNIYIDNIRLSGQSSKSTFNLIENSLLVSPNPNNGSFNVKFNVPHELIAGRLSLIDPYGKIVYATNLDTNQKLFNQNIRIDNIVSGIYYLKIRDKTNILNHKIMIVK